MRPNSTTESQDEKLTTLPDKTACNFGEYLNEKTDKEEALCFIEKYIWTTIKNDLKNEIKTSGVQRVRK
jgi:hypothetical protein